MDFLNPLVDTEAAPEAKQAKPSQTSAGNSGTLEAQAKEENSEVGVKIMKKVWIPARHAKIVPVRLVDMEGAKSKDSVNMLKLCRE